MKSVRFVFSVVLLSLSTLAFAQSDAQKSFDKLKTLAGSWEGNVTTIPQEADIEGKMMQVSLRATSMGNALMHEMTGAGRPDDPITMLYVDERPSAADPLLRRRESTSHDRQDVARRKHGRIRVSRRRR